MDSTKNQQTLSLIFYPRPWLENRLKEDLRSFQFRDSPTVVYRCPDAEYERNNDSSLYMPSTYPIVWCDNKDSDFKQCFFCQREIVKTTGYYSCGTFDERLVNTYWSERIFFHKECIQPVKYHPYHPKHSLQALIFPTVEPQPNKVCYCCYNKRLMRSFHYCSICNFTICYDCGTKPVRLTIDHKKRHKHPLTYIPREASMICDVCALGDKRYFIYVCHQCDFVVHKECVYSPSIIKVSRHEHRLSFTSSFLHGNWSCGVCRKKVDENYGGYSCVKGCHYAVHSKCATNKNVWDGKELERVPEDVYEDITPFKEVGDGIIQHFSHNHYMRLHEDIDKVNKESNFCQVCALPIYDGHVFSCMECDFFLHKVCAYDLPLKKQHAMHRHPLVLQKSNQEKVFRCNACTRLSNGFRYMCEGVDYCSFILDVHCALVSEPFDHHCHPHLLFLPSKTDWRRCSICREEFMQQLVCEECEFVLCFHCATLPKKFTYKHDEHPLIFCYEEDVNDQHWCDVCEKEAFLKNGIYMCNGCDVTLHVECLFGEDMFILPNKIISGFGQSVLNNRLTRQICARCHKRCHQNKTFYIDRSEVLAMKTFCSTTCRKYYISVLCS